MNTNTLIILGKGSSRTRLNAYRAAHPAAQLWTLNNFFPAGDDPLMHGFDLAAETDLHFDVHYDQRFWCDMDKIPSKWVVSPFRESPDPSRIRPFPLDQAFESFGHAYFESSLCYMLALAAMLRDACTSSFSTICLPGVDMEDPTHFAYRYGLHFWLGILRGQGVTLEIPNESACLQRYAGARSVDTEPEFPHIYGQPWSVTSPLKAKYGWKN
jgi:hypothetical protein